MPPSMPGSMPPLQRGGGGKGGSHQKKKGKGGKGSSKKDMRSSLSKKKEPPMPSDLPGYDSANSDSEDNNLSDSDVEFVTQNASRLGFLTPYGSKHGNSDDSAASPLKEKEGIKASKLRESEYVERVMQRRELERLREQREQQMLEQSALASPLPVKTPTGQVLAATPATHDANDANAATPLSLTKAQRRTLQKQEKRKAKESAAAAAAAAPAASEDEEDGTTNAATTTTTTPPPSDEMHDRLAILDSLTSRQERLDEAKQSIALLSTRLVASPQDHVASLSLLINLLSDSDATVASIAMLSLFSIFVDIVPGYRITTNSTLNEPAMTAGGKGNKKVSRDVADLRSYESKLLAHYTSYVNALIACSKSCPSSNLNPPKRIKTATHCLCSLIQRIPHFNLSSAILRTIVPLMCAASEDLHKPCCQAVQTSLSLAADPSGLLQKECGDLVANLVLKRACRVPERVIDSLVTAQFDSNIIYAAPSDGASRAKGGGKKRGGAKRKRDEVDDAFAEAEATTSTVARRRAQSLLLRSLADALLRVLRAAELLVANNDDLDVDERMLAAIPVQSALRGIARIGHLLDVAVVSAAMAALGRIASAGIDDDDDDDAFSPSLKTRNTWPLSVRVAAVQASCNLLRANGGALAAEGASTDYEALFTALYHILSQVDGNTDPSLSNYESLVQCSQALLLETGPRIVGEARAAAFVKRLLRAAASTSASEVGAALGLMTVARSLLHAHVRARALLDGDAPVQSGRFNENATRPDAANALAGTLWEVEALRKHVHPLVRDLADLIVQPLDSDSSRGSSARLARLGGPGVRPEKMCRKFPDIGWTGEED
ncbi:nucleolar complex protein 3 [Pseudoscourfieldia marina]